MKMEFMEGKKTIHIHSCLLWERGRNKRLTQVLPWPADCRQDFQEQRLHWEQAKQLLRGFTVTLFHRDLECFPTPRVPPWLGWTKPVHLQRKTSDLQH